MNVNNVCVTSLMRLHGDFTNENDMERVFVI